jgi:hypothetical protein
MIATTVQPLQLMTFMKPSICKRSCKSKISTWKWTLGLVSYSYAHTCAHSNGHYIFYCSIVTAHRKEFVERSLAWRIWLIPIMHPFLDPRRVHKLMASEACEHRVKISLPVPPTCGGQFGTYVRCLKGNVPLVVLVLLVSWSLLFLASFSNFEIILCIYHISVLR